MPHGTDEAGEGVTASSPVSGCRLWTVGSSREPREQCIHTWIRRNGLEGGREARLADGEPGGRDPLGGWHVPNYKPFKCQEDSRERNTFRDSQPTCPEVIFSVLPEGVTENCMRMPHVGKCGSHCWSVTLNIHLILITCEISVSPFKEEKLVYKN